MKIGMIYLVLGIAFSIFILSLGNEFLIDSEKYYSGCKKKKYQRLGYSLMVIGIMALIACFVLGIILFNNSAAP